MPSNSKSSSTARRVSSGLAKVSTPPTSTRNSKASKASKIVCLKLSSKALKRFASDTTKEAPSPTPPIKQPPDTASTASTQEQETKAIQVKPESSSPPGVAAGSDTPQPAGKDSVVGKNTTKESTPKTGSKRSLGAGVDGPKPRARPGPKKKIKVDDANGDNGGSTIKMPSTSMPGHKLGPKANQGAINAGLRALDRTGKPCRKWEKSGFRLKTFTGIAWELSTWRAPPKSFGSGESPEKGSLPTSKTHSKENNSSSQVGSDNSAATPLARIKSQPPNSLPASTAIAT
ncbi:MAG: hypothetical protein Q9186_003505 [Xanthomendoza sp. 1 TL-2023]